MHTTIKSYISLNPPITQPNNRKTNSHMTLQESLALLDQLEPQRAFLVGMCCDVGGHDEMNARLRAMGYPHVQLAYDGMVLRGMPLR